MYLIGYMLGKTEESAAYTDIAFEQRDSNLLAWRVWPFFDSIKEDPIYQTYLQRMNFPA